jgi:hypothetical protein
MLSPFSEWWKIFDFNIIVCWFVAIKKCPVWGHRFNLVVLLRG